jgi:hypothetical protein
MVQTAVKLLLRISSNNTLMVMVFTNRMMFLKTHILQHSQENDGEKGRAVSFSPKTVFCRGRALRADPPHSLTEDFSLFHGLGQPRGQAPTRE